MVRGPGFLRRHLPLLLVLLVGAGLRVLATLAYHPALRFPDSSRYLTSAQTLQPDPLRPLGYSVLLRLLTPLGSIIWVPVAQHLLGLGVVVLLYAFGLRLGLRRWLATLAVAPIALDAYEIQIEEYVLAETLFLILLIVALVLLCWSRRPSYLAVIGCGLLLAAAALTRSAALPLIVVPVGYLLVRRAGWLRLVAVVVAFALPLIGYAQLTGQSQGKAQLTSDSGRLLYGRVAPFADCRQLSALPASQRALCESTPPAERTTGSEWYDWNRSSPAASFRGADSDAVLRAFAMRVIVAQPVAYAAEIAHDSLHYFLPGRSVAPQDGCQDFWRFSDPPAQTMQVCSSGSLKVGWLGVIDFGFDHQPVEHSINSGAVSVLRDYQGVAYTPGPLLGLGLLLSLLALVRFRWLSPAARHRAAAAAVLGLTGAALVVVPAATAVFSYRYGLPLIALLPFAGALALSALIPRSTTDPADAPA